MHLTEANIAVNDQVLMTMGRAARLPAKTDLAVTISSVTQTL
jgi:hypothetical protein